MTPQEKAKELVDRYWDYQWAQNTLRKQKRMSMTFSAAKYCALIAVDEILESEPRCPSNVDWDDVGGTHQYYYEAQREDANKYWQEVKKEIELL